MNTKGQMIIAESKDFEDSNASWFFDGTVFHSLGYMDELKRWAPLPLKLSQNGFVMGIGQDTYRKEKIFIWHHNTGIKEINPLGPLFSIEGINDKGQIIGNIEIPGKRSDYTHAFIICLELGFTDLGMLDMGMESHAYAINNHGQVVGRSETGKARNERAFIWDNKKGMRDLNTLIPQNSPGWQELSYALAINDAGYIVGTGNYYGVEQYFLLIPKDIIANDANKSP